jgi:hypothetical protein
MGRAVASKRSLAAVIVCKRGSKPARGIGGGGLGADGGNGMADGVSSQVSDICGSKYLFFRQKVKTYFLTTSHLCDRRMCRPSFNWCWGYGIAGFYQKQIAGLTGDLP